ncbi:hypothetical protein [Aestuariivirga sp.]|uniref:hypothetical protein n=1 Tax=Aestuariivirga sp. TaxID=2650926 RepID=UPI003BAAADFB
MSAHRQGTKCHFSVSEPIEFKFEGNPQPLSVELLDSATVKGKEMVLLGADILSNGRRYSLGLASARYTGDNIIPLIASALGCNINGVFFRDEDLKDCAAGQTAEEVAAVSSSISLSDRLLLVGNLRLASLCDRELSSVQLT